MMMMMTVVVVLVVLVKIWQALQFERPNTQTYGLMLPWQGRVYIQVIVVTNYKRVHANFIL